MSDVLSQAEIDALLNKFDSGEMDIAAEPNEPSVKVRNYDFRTADRFHKEQIRTLHVIYDTFARLLGSYLSGTLRVMASAEVMAVEELKYQEFSNALPSPVVLAILNQPPMIGPTIFEISPDIAYAMIARLLGGSGIGGGALGSREFTEIELVLIERVLRQFLYLFEESWEKVAKLKVSLDRIETSPQFAQIVALNETVAVISINIKIDNVEGMVNICLPHLALEPINLSTRMMYQASEHRRAIPAQEDITRRISRTQLDVTAVFNDTPVPLRDVRNLEPGDVIKLDHAVGMPLTLMVGHLTKFKGDLGVKDNRYAIKITEVLRKEDLE